MQRQQLAAAPLPLLAADAAAVRVGLPTTTCTRRRQHPPRGRPEGAFGQVQYPTPPLRLHDTTIRRHWEAARKVNARGETVTLDPDGPLAEAAWAKQRLGRVTQALPNGYCGLPVQKSCPHANACLTCPMFVTTPEFLPQHREHRRQILRIITAAEARGQQRLAEMNQQVLGNLDRIITGLHDASDTTAGEREEVADAG